MCDGAESEPLEIDLPAMPDVLVRLSLLMAEDDIDLAAASALIASDMTLAAAVLKAVNSPLYGVKGRVQSVQQALTYLGMREVVAITYEMGLRAAFPPAPELLPIWSRAARRGLLMGRIGQQLDVDPWHAHSAGLFEECGKAALLRHAPEHYPSMLRAAGSDTELVTLEQAGFGIGHDALGATLTESWGVAGAAAASVRHHVRVQAGGDLPAAAPAVCALSALAHALLARPDTLEEVGARVSPQAGFDTDQALRAALRVREQLAANEA
jgi:HD-like signal output (HDOD) protein